MVSRWLAGAFVLAVVVAVAASLSVLPSTPFFRKCLAVALLVLLCGLFFARRMHPANSPTAASSAQTRSPRSSKKGSNSLRPELRRWMERTGAHGRPIGALLLPGTHDSGAYQTLHPTPLRDWVITQAASVRAQLDMGVRMLDLRVWTVLGTNYVSHAVTCARLGEILQQLRAFLRRNKGEAVFVNIKPDPLHSADMAAVRAEMRSALGALYTETYDKRQLLGDLVSSGQRAVVCLVPTVETLWLNARNLRTWQDKFADLPDENAGPRLRDLQVTLTPAGLGFFRNNSAGALGVRDLAAIVRPKIFSDVLPRARAFNAVTVDFADEEVVAAIVAANS